MAMPQRDETIEEIKRLDAAGIPRVRSASPRSGCPSRGARDGRAGARGGRAVARFWRADARLVRARYPPSAKRESAKRMP